MKKFTSEDLLNAMGLKVGDIIEYGEMKFEVRYSEWNGRYYIYSEKPKGQFWLNDIVDEDYTIIQPKPTLTEDEKVILRNLPKEWKWITRDVNNYLYLSNFKPLKIEEIGYWEINEPNGRFQELIYDNLFKFIKLEDEPYSIEELLKD